MPIGRSLRHIALLIVSNHPERTMSVEQLRMNRIQLQPWQLSTLIGSVGVVAMGTMMAITNPSRNAYNSHVANQASSYLQKNVCSQTQNYFGNWLQQECHDLVAQGKPSIKQLVNLSTQRDNYLFFSVYETEVSVMESLPSYETKKIGFLGQFWEIPD